MSKDGMYLCAEVGVNWLGDVNILNKWVRELAQAGVDAVKLQLFDIETLNKYPKALKKQLKPMILEPSDIITVSDILRKQPNRPDLIVTPFNKNCVSVLENLKDYIDGIKIRAKDWTDRDLIEQARRLGKPMYISVPYEKDCVKIPANTPKEHFLTMRGNNTFRVYCIPKYPPEPSEMHLNRIIEHDGVSLHSPNWSTHFAAASIAIMHQYVTGAKRRFYIEVHGYPIHANAPVDDMPDFKVSVSTIGIALLAEALNALEEEIG